MLVEMRELSFEGMDQPVRASTYPVSRTAVSDRLLLT